MMVTWRQPQERTFGIGGRPTSPGSQLATTTVDLDKGLTWLRCRLTGQDELIEERIKQRQLTRNVFTFAAADRGPLSARAFSIVGMVVTFGMGRPQCYGRTVMCSAGLGAT